METTDVQRTTVSPSPVHVVTKKTKKCACYHCGVLHIASTSQMFNFLEVMNLGTYETEPAELVDAC